LEIKIWDFDNSIKGNIVTNLLLQNNTYKNFKQQLNENIVEHTTIGNKEVFGSFDMLPYIHTTYGTKSQVCLLDKIWREIKRIGEQIIDFLEDTANRLWDLLEDITDKITEEVTRIIENITDAIISVVNKVVKEFKRLIGGC
jgi:hypothetical protein